MQREKFVSWSFSIVGRSPHKFLLSWGGGAIKKFKKKRKKKSVQNAVVSETLEVHKFDSSNVDQERSYFSGSGHRFVHKALDLPRVVQMTARTLLTRP